MKGACECALGGQTDTAQAKEAVVGIQRVGRDFEFLKKGIPVAGLQTSLAKLLSDEIGGHLRAWSKRSPAGQFFGGQKFKIGC